MASEYSRKHQLECLRLASDLPQLANSNVSPGLRIAIPSDGEGLDKPGGIRTWRELSEKTLKSGGSPVFVPAGPRCFVPVPFASFFAL
jgi:hypothetical protein